MDLFVMGANKVPTYGESVLCGEYGFSTGGKGANQALAFAKLGGNVSMVGCVGKDNFGEKLISSLNNDGVNTSFINVKEDCQTGIAIMLVQDETAKYVCYVGMGANNYIEEKDVEKAIRSANFDMIVMQLEMPLGVVYKIVELGRELHIPIFLDAGPPRDIDMSRLKGIDFISPNEAETFALTGIEILDTASAKKAAKYLYDNILPKYVLLKIGEKGSLLYDGDKYLEVPAFKVNAVDTTAAGDTFGAGFVIQHCSGESLENSITFATAAAGICVSKKGAQTSIPDKKEVDKFLRSVKK
ncbi:ribokinase [Candidatus Epulonipiscium fishelsonii]|uniref:Ribokinase n=1 Tax=Candidatus Epulonipiscium fishelsonii TaxID=77094 RepID=A0ACC8XFJ9_9FIRM|nr:ribokinase [Epulopiscium sp. SCG-B05WGA-EpuloA1]ONI41913.1 ribokinase [Epulopiscium sp. SCG-B11WGA-EpuloA1]ONI47095.1 ribokinase [Epulopiscium sp. SCG-C06WGA-EpuloA1]